MPGREAAGFYAIEEKEALRDPRFQEWKKPRRNGTFYVRTSVSDLVAVDVVAVQRVAIPVTAGLAADGYVEISCDDERVVPGAKVVVGT